MSNHDDPTSMTSLGLMFTIFNRLPIELQLKIWEAALSDPRVINIRQKELWKTGPWRNMMGATSDTKAPSVLFACRDSYNVASKFYIPSFAFADSIPETYFDLQRDTLYLRLDTFALHFDGDWYGDTVDELECLYESANLRRVQNLAMLLDPDPVLSTVSYRMIRSMSTYPSEARARYFCINEIVDSATLCLLISKFPVLDKHGPHAAFAHTTYHTV